LQEEKTTLKQAADLLGINYSTAKTIIQTFRKEKRIAKKSKHMVETKKAIKKSQFLTRFLTKAKVESLLDSILLEELVVPEHKLIKEDHNVSDSCTAPVFKIIPNASSKVLARVDSAAQMLLFDEVEEGPGRGQRTRAISVSFHENKEYKHNFFYVYSETDPEMKYKDKIDYNDPILLRAKTSDRHNVNSHLDLGMEHNNKPELTFDFSEYKTKILKNPHIG